jgi:hypothetical protein
MSSSHILAQSVEDFENEINLKQFQMLGQLRQPDIYREFIAFMSKSKSPTFLFIANLFFSILTFPIVFRNTSGFNNDLQGIIHYCDTIFSLIIVVSGWTLYALFIKKHSNSSKNKKFLSMDVEKLCNLIQAIFYIALVVSHCTYMIHRILNGPCHGSLVTENRQCNPMMESQFFPPDTAVILMMLPIFFIVVMREVRIFLTIFCWLFVIGSFILASFLMNTYRTAPVIVFYFTFSFILILDCYKHYFLLYLCNRKLRTTLDMNKVLSEQNRAIEMRHLIANVAHDLKTVSLIVVF